MATSTRPRRSRAAADPAAGGSQAPLPPEAAPPAPRRVAAKKRPAAEPAAARQAAKKAPAQRAAAGVRKTAPPPAPSPAAAPQLPRRRKTVPAAAPLAPPVEPTAARSSALRLAEGDERRVVWCPGADCPAPLAEAARECFDEAGRLRPEGGDALPRWLRLARSSGHPVSVGDAVWPHLAVRRDMRHRLAVLQAAYRDEGALAGVTKLALAPFQAEGALWSVVAGRALLADERGLGKAVQAIAAAQLWQRHFGLTRVLVVCAPAQRVAWQRAWKRVAGVEAQVIDGTVPASAAVRIAAPGMLSAGASADWAPQLLIVDEPQLLGLELPQWTLLDAPQALVLCGAALDEQPALLDTLVDWLDRDRVGPLAALREVQSAREHGAALADAEIARLDEQLSRLLLQRQRADLALQLPRRIFSERVFTVGAAQRAAHDRALDVARRLIALWRGCGWLSDADQWQLGRALRAMRSACQREDPLDPHSALAAPVVDALRAQLDEWALGGTHRVALRCAGEADRAQLAARLGERPGLALVGPAEPLPADAEAVLQVGVPWCLDFADGAADDAPPGRQWMLLVAQDSIDSGLFDTLALRRGVPAGPDDTGFLEAEALASWLSAVDAALEAVAASG